MATAEFSATIGTVQSQASSSNLIGATTAAVPAALTSLDTAMATAVTALGTITYSATTHQFTGTFVSAPTPTAANLNAMVTALNTALGLVKTANTAAGAVNADVSVYIGSLTNVSSLDLLENAWRAIKKRIMGAGIMAVGSGNPRNPE